MQLDFLTLYVIVLLNSLTMAVIWGAIAVTHRDFGAARYWLASSVLTTFGGALFALDGTEHGRIMIIGGNALIVAGFFCIRMGLSVFDNRKPRWEPLIAGVGAALLAVTLAGDARPGQNVAMAVTQLVPLGLIAAYLVRSQHRSLGAVVAAIAAGVAFIGQSGEAATNTLRLTGLLTTGAYYEVAALFLVAAIFGGGLWNIGFLLMAIDRLRANLAALAVTDDLTGLPNRRQFMATAAAYSGDRKVAGQGIALLLIDIDEFKAINDTFGHAAGDAALRHVARIAGERLRPRDLLARIAGDEFCAMLPDCGTRGAAEVARDLVESVAANALGWNGDTIALSISVGATVWRPDGSVSVAASLEQADRGLYAAKRAGRNGYHLREVPPFEDDGEDRPAAGASLAAE